MEVLPTFAKEPVLPKQNVHGCVVHELHGIISLPSSSYGEGFPPPTLSLQQLLERKR